MTQLQRIDSLIQQAKARSRKPRFKWREAAFDKQISFIEDPARLKGLFTTRRGAKSYADGIYLVKEAEETDKCNCLFLSLTRLSAKGIIWKDVLKDINEKHNLGMTFHETELTATTSNGSCIYVAGVDVDENERKKLFGRKYKLVVIDEAALFGIDLHDLVYVVLRPSVTDLRGTIVMSGMASNITRGLFYDITNKKEAGWSLHEWTAHDNPYVAKQWQEELDFIAKHQPLLMKTPRFRQAYLNHWVVDEAAKVYKYSPTTNRLLSLPQSESSYSHVLGLDLAHSPDSTAFVVSAYNPSDPRLYFRYARKHLKMDITAAAEELHRLNRIYDFDVKVVDGANKMAVEEMNNRHGCGLIPADKTGKADFIKLMNDDFVQNKIVLLPEAYLKHEPEVDSLEDEYEALVWITEDGKVVEPRKEHPGLHNDLCDGALYNWRYCYQYLFKPTEPQVDYHSQERWEKDHIKSLAEEVRREQNPNEFDLSFDRSLFDFNQDDTL